MLENRLKNSLKVDNQNNYISIDLSDQTFKFDKKENINDNESFEMIYLTAVFAVGIIITGLVVYFLKKLNYRNVNDNEDELF